MNTEVTQRSSLLDGECVAEEISKSFQKCLRWRSEEIKVEKRHNVKYNAYIWILKIYAILKINGLYVR